MEKSCLHPIDKRTITRFFVWCDSCGKLLDVIIHPKNNPAAIRIANGHYHSLEMEE